MASSCMAAKIEQKKREILAKFAEDLNVPDIAVFAKCFSYVKLAKGATVFEAGAVADRLYIVGKGQVWVQLQGGQGYQASYEKPSQVITEGHAFGIEALYSEVRPRIHSVHVASEEGAYLLYLKRDEYLSSASAIVQIKKQRKSSSDTYAAILGDLPFMVDNHESRQKLQFLRKIPFLSGASDVNLRLLAPCFTFHVYRPGEVIFETASYPDALYFLIEGHVQMTCRSYSSNKRDDPDDVEEVVVDVKHGCIGELDLLLKLPGRCTTARVAGSVKKGRAGGGSLKSRDSDGALMGGGPFQGDAHVLIIGRYSFDNYLLYCDDAVRAALRQLPIDATVKIVSEVPFFKRMRPESITRLAEVCRRRFLDADELLFKAGDVPDEESVFFIVEFGSVLVYPQKASQNKTKAAALEAEEGGVEEEGEAVARLGPGRYLGELALMTDSPRRASIRGGGRQGDMKTILLGISRDDFEHVIQQEPEARAECALRILGKKTDLATILIHPDTYTLFAERLREAFSEETALFWRAVHEYEVMCFASQDMGLYDDDGDDNDDYDGEEEESDTNADGGGGGGGGNMTVLEKVWADVSLLVAIEDTLELTKEMKKRVELVMKFGLASSKKHAAELLQLWERKREANKIIDKYITIGSAHQVNVKSAMRQRVEAARDESRFDPEMFKECKDECFKLMSGSDLDAFLDSKPFEHYLSDLGAYNRTSESLNAAQMWDEYSSKLRNTEVGGSSLGIRRSESDFGANLLRKNTNSLRNSAIY